MKHFLVLCALTGAGAMFPHHYLHPGDLQVSLMPPVHQKAASKLVGHSLTCTQAAAAISRPTDFGADPAGEHDSTASVQAAVAHLLTLGSQKRDAQGRVDLGGAVLDLSGGIYSISSTILLPPGYANFRLQRGTFTAATNFSADSFMLQVGSDYGCNSTSGGSKNFNCNMDVSISEVTLDGNGISHGGLLVQDSMNVNIGPSVMVTGFSAVGISMAGSGASYIHEAWLGQYPPGSKVPRDQATATGILLGGTEHDCDVNNVIIFSGLVGVNSTNGANRLQGVHTWNLSGKQGGTGIRLHKGSGRVQQSYLDFAPLVVAYSGQWMPKFTAVEGNLFLGSSSIVLEANAASSVVSGLVATGNTFHRENGVNRTFVLDETRGNFTGVQDSVVEGNVANGQIDKAKPAHLGSRATMMANVPVGSNSVLLDFDPWLIFAGSIGIAPDSVQCTLLGRFPVAITFEVAANKVTAHLGAKVPQGSGPVSVRCSIDQSTRTAPAH